MSARGCDLAGSSDWSVRSYRRCVERAAGFRARPRSGAAGGSDPWRQEFSGRLRWKGLCAGWCPAEGATCKRSAHVGASVGRCAVRVPPRMAHRVRQPDGHRATTVLHVLLRPWLWRTLCRTVPGACRGPATRCAVPRAQASSGKRWLPRTTRDRRTRSPEEANAHMTICAMICARTLARGGGNFRNNRDAP